MISASWNSYHLFLKLLYLGRIKKTWYRAIFVEFISEAEYGRIFSVFSAFVFAHVDIEIAQLWYVLLFDYIVFEVGEIRAVSVWLFLWKMLRAHEVGLHGSSTWIHWTFCLSKCSLMLFRGHGTLWDQGFIEVIQTVSILMVREKSTDSITKLLIKSRALIIVWKSIFRFSCLVLSFAHSSVHLWAILVGQLGGSSIVLKYVNLILFF